MSLDDIGREVWSSIKPPLALLVASRMTEMLASPLPEPSRDAFHALSRALLAWWPKREREPKDLYEHEFAACVEAASASGASAIPARTGAYVQMAALLALAPRSLPADGFYDLREDAFLELLGQAAKTSRLPRAQLEARLAFLLERKREPWPALVARSARMRWERSAPWGKLEKRVRELAAFADLGAESSWSKIGDQDVLQLRVDGTRRTAALRPDELAALRTIIPTLAEPA